MTKLKASVLIPIAIGIELETNILTLYYKIDALPTDIREWTIFCKNKFPFSFIGQVIEQSDKIVFKITKYLDYKNLFECTQERVIK